MVVAFGLRLFRLEEISTSLDELSFVGFLATPLLSDFLNFIRFPNPETVPVYPVLIHFLKHGFGLSLEGMRVASVLISMTAFPLLYGLAAQAFNRKAAVAALGLFALSAPYIWHSHTVRFYVLFPVLALVSAHLLLWALRSKSLGAWAGYFVVMGVMMWTHVFMLFLVAAQGLYLLLFTGTRFRHLVAWGVVSAVIVVSPVVWLQTSWHRIPDAETNTEHRVPTLREAVLDLFGDDATVVHKDFEMAFSIGYHERLLEERPGEYPYLEFQRMLRGWHGWFDGAMVLFFGCAFGVSLIRIVPAAIRQRLGAACGTDVPKLQGEALMLTMAMVPLLLMCLFTFLWRPVVEPRFTLYSALGLYVLAGGAISRLPSRGLQSGMAVVLLLIYGYQLSMLYPHSLSRSDWSGASRYVLAAWQPNDMIVSRFTYVKPFDARRFEMGRPELRQRTVHTFEGACHTAEVYLRESGVVPAPRVWAMFSQEGFDLPYGESFEPALLARGLRFEKRDFPGPFPIRVYRIEDDPERAPLPELPPFASRLDYGQMMEQLGLPRADTSLSPEAFEQVLRRVAIDEFAAPSELAFFALNDESPGFAAAVAEADAEGPPLIAAFSLGELGHPDAPAAMGDALSMGYMDEATPMIPLFRILYIDKNLEAARAEAERLDPERAILPEFLRRRLGFEQSWQRPG